MPNDIRQPCPFDQSRNLSVESFVTGHGAEFNVVCNACGAKGPVASSRADAVRKWNTRSSRRGDGEH